MLRLASSSQVGSDSIVAGLCVLRAHSTLQSCECRDNMFEL
jgi:hypothetical protein